MRLHELTQYTRDELERIDTDVLDVAAFGVKGGDVIELSPQEIKIKWHDDLENPQYAYQRGGTKWLRSVDLSEPVQVSLDQHGQYWLEDGHHRWFAANKLGKKLKAEVDIKANPIDSILDQQKAGKHFKL